MSQSNLLTSPLSSPRREVKPGHPSEHDELTTVKSQMVKLGNMMKTELTVLKNAVAHLSDRLDGIERMIASKGNRNRSPQRAARRSLPRPSTRAPASASSSASASSAASSNNRNDNKSKAGSSSSSSNSNSSSNGSTPSRARTRQPQTPTGGRPSSASGSRAQTAPVQRSSSRSSGLGKSTSSQIMNRLLGARTPDDGSSDRERVDPKRRGSYYVGPKKIHVTMPQSYMDEHPNFAAKHEKRSPSEMAKAPEGDEPEGKLELAYAYGYNGRTARHNVAFNPTNKDELVYCLAGVGVVMKASKEAAERKQRFFFGHNEDVISLAVHPTRAIVATGQLDPKGAETPYVCIWDADSMEELQRIYFHDRGVCALSFSHDGKYLASVGQDDSHSLAIWEWEAMDKKKQQQEQTPLLERLTSKEAVFGVEFNPKPRAGNDFEFVTYGNRLLKYWAARNVSDKDKKKRMLKGSIVQSYGATKITQKAYYCVAFFDNGEWVTGCHSGHVYRFKTKSDDAPVAEDESKDNSGKNDDDALKTATSLYKAYKVYERPVATISVMDDGGFITGGGDGTFKLFNAEFEEKASVSLGEGIRPIAAAYANNKLVIGTRTNELLELDVTADSFQSDKPTQLMEGHSGEIWALAVHPIEPVFVSGAHDKTLVVWDYEARCTREKKLTFESRVRSACFNIDGSKLAIATWNGTVALIDWATFSVTKQAKVATETIDCLAWQPIGGVLAAGSWDQSVYVLSAEDLSVQKTLTGHTSSVLMVDFSDDGKYIMSCSRDYELLYWDITKSERQARVKKTLAYADVEFSNWHCFLGWPVQGIWSDVGDGTDLNAVDGNFDIGLLALGDDFGQVRLFSFPSVEPRSKYVAFQGHSSHVTNVRFSPNSDYLFSTGGADYGVFQWNVVGATKKNKPKKKAWAEENEIKENNADDAADKNSEAAAANEAKATTATE